jgi:hypothetical protein
VCSINPKLLEAVADTRFNSVDVNVVGKDAVLYKLPDTKALLEVVLKAAPAIVPAVVYCIPNLATINQLKYVDVELPGAAKRNTGVEAVLYLIE